MHQDEVVIDYSAKRPFGHEGEYRGVYEAKLNGAPCIVKCVRDILRMSGVPSERAAEVVERFNDERALLSNLRHPNVVQFLGTQVGSEPSDVALAFEYLHTSLDRCLRQHSHVPLPTSLSILRDVSRGLLYLHSRVPAVAHGELHARNVLLSKDMAAKIADLGTSKLLGYGSEGTPLDHLPPEAMATLKDIPRQDCKIDVFAFGVLCLRVALNKPVSGADGEEDMDPLRTEAQRREEGVLMLDHAHHPLHGLVVQCLHDERERRPSAAGVSTEMEALCSDLVTGSKDILEVQEELAAIKDRFSQLFEAHSQLQMKQVRTLSLSGVQRRSVGQGSTLQRGNTKLEGSQQATPPNMTGSRPSNHIFEKKTYFQPTYCQHCTKMLWGLKEQGLECRVCNFVSHERCVSQLVVPCRQTTPPEESTEERHQIVRMVQYDDKTYCSVCRRRISCDGELCEVCHQYAHVGCGTSLFKACRDCASYCKQSKNAHHWIEGNLPAGSLCIVCGKVCATSDCLSSFRCCSCGQTVHTACKGSYHQDNCDYGNVKSIILPPRAVYIQPSWLLTEDAGVPEQNDAYTTEGPLSPRHEQRQCVVMDGRLLTLPITRATTAHDILTTSLGMLASSTSESCHLVELKDNGDERPIASLSSLQRGAGPVTLMIQQRKPGSQREVVVSNGCLPSRLVAAEVNMVALTTVSEIIAVSLKAFGLEGCNEAGYSLVEMSPVSGERVMNNDECPLKAATGPTHVHSPLLQYILRQRHGYEGITVYVWGISKDVLTSKSSYTEHMKRIIAKASPGLLSEGLLSMVIFGPAFPTYGGVFVEFPTMDMASKVCTALQESSVKVKLLPSIYPDQLDDHQEVLLVFINEKSGGNQGRSLLSGFRRHLNPHQVFNLAEGGPLPGLFAFRKVKRFSVLIGGGDGTFGWVLSSITDIQPHLACDNPPCALLPLGTGNDLARALKWGPGYTDEKVMDLLNGVKGAETVGFDRWEISFFYESGNQLRTAVMNNYFGIGLDAAIALDFHNAREENPDRFNSRFKNKKVYFQLGLQKMVQKERGVLNSRITVEVDDSSELQLPELEGISILNIQSWGGGSDPWGASFSEEGFVAPSYSDGLLEVIGISGMVHMGQILSGMRIGLRLKQSHEVTIILHEALPIQVDGEAWLQPPGRIFIRRSQRQAKMKVRSVVMKGQPSSGVV